jgi:hypothetical protein
VGALQFTLSGLHSHFITCQTHSDSEAQALLSQGRPALLAMAAQRSQKSISGFSFQSWNIFFCIYALKKLSTAFIFRVGK